MNKLAKTVLMGFILLSPTTSAEPKNVYSISTDVLLTSLNPAIGNAVSGFYGSPRLYGLYDAKILKIERIDAGGFLFNVTVQVKTFVGPHNPPYGIETITLAVSPSTSLVEKYHHEGEK